MADYEEMRQLQEQYRIDHERMLAMRQSMAKWTKEQTEALTAQLNAALARQDADYRSALSALMQDAAQKHTAEMQRLRAEYKQLEEKHAKLERQFSAQQQTLESELNRIMQKRERQEHSERNSAETALSRLTALCSRTAALPVEHFYPNKLDIYRRAAARCRDLMRQSMYTAALNAAESGRLGVERLQCDTERKMQEFHLLIQQYRMQYQAIRDVLASDAGHQICCADGTAIRFDDTELDYWSDGLYRVLLDETETHGRLIAAIRRDENAWLNTCTEQDAAAYIRKQIEKLMQLPELFRVCISFSFSAHACYEETFRIAQEAEAVLNQQNFVRKPPVLYGAVQDQIPKTPGWDAVYSRYLRNEQCLRPGALPDYREERCILFQRQIGRNQPESIRLRVIPVRNEDLVDYTVILETASEHGADQLRETVQRMLEHAGIPVTGSAHAASPELRIMDRTQAEQIAAKRLLQFEKGVLS